VQNIPDCRHLFPDGRSWGAPSEDVVQSLFPAFERFAFPLSPRSLSLTGRKIALRGVLCGVPVRVCHRTLKE
jgi:hypothetical protein